MTFLRPGASTLLVVLSLSACAMRTSSPLTAPVAECRATSAAVAVKWSIPDDAGNRSRLDRFCAGTGPVLFESAHAGAASAYVDAREVAFISWNLHVGAGDVERFVGDLKAGRLTDGRTPAQVVLMLQEAVRSEGVPARLPDGASAARRIGTAGAPGNNSFDIEAVAHRLGMSLLYVPSMRNGSPSDRYRATDRGNAILSTLPLSAPTAIELPGERQGACRLPRPCP